MNRSSLHRIHRIGLAASGLALLATPAFAQFRASIQGTVTDSTGAIVPNASLTLLDTDTNRSLTATSNASGTYNFNALAPDHYTLTTTAAGFQKNIIANVPINPDEASSVNVSMALGDIATVVNVQGDQVATLDTETATISGNISDNQIQHLPSSGRDVFQLAQLAPGVFGEGSRASGGGSSNLPGNSGPGGSSAGAGIFSTENGPQINANGGQSETNGISIDGISTVSAVWGGHSVITPTEDSVGNVKVVSNQYDAENGRFSGANIQITSKTGSNDIHGSAFFRAQRPGLNAYQRWNGANTYNPGTAIERGLIRDPERANQFGGSIGGPIWKNHLFAFFAYETQRDNSTVPTNSWFETPSFRAASRPGSIASVYNNFQGAAPAGATLVNQTCAAAGLNEVAANGPITCHTIPGQGLDIGSPLTSALGTQDPTYVSNLQPGVGSGFDGNADLAFYQTQNPTTRVGQQYNGRLDADATKKDHLAFAIYWVPLSVTNFNGSVRSYNLYHHDQINDAYSGIWNHVFSPSLLNEARFNDAGWRWNEITTNPQEPFGLPQSNITTRSGATIGNINSTDFASFGAPGPSEFNQHTYTYKDVATKVVGNHTIKFGADLTRLYYLNTPTYSARPNYNFFNLWNFLNDAPWKEAGSFLNATGTPGVNRQDTRVNLWGGFIQDAWKAKPNLTLNFGVRYNYFGAFYSKQNNLGVVQFGGSPATTYTGLSIRQGGPLITPQTANVGPQFGFSYAPEGLRNRVVLRGGYGMNFNQSEIAILGNSGNNPPFIFNADFENTGTTGPIDPRIVYGAPGGNSLFGYPSNPNATTTLNSANLPIASGISVTAYQNRQPTIATQHYSVDTEVDLGHQLVATVGFNGSVTRHLIVQSGLYANAFANGQAFNPLIQNVDYYSNTGNSNNNSLLVGIKHNLSHDIQFDAEFNYSKTMDTGSYPYYEDPYPYRPDLAYGKSDFNFGKAFKVYGLWQPHLWHGSHLLGQVLDGWSVSGIYNMHTGFPFTPLLNTGALYYSGSPYGQLRPASYNGGAGKIRSNAAYKQGGANLNFPNAGPKQPYFNNPNTGINPIVTGTTPTGVIMGTDYTLPTLPGVARNTFTGPGYLDLDATVAKSFGFHPGRFVGEHAALEIRADAFNLFNNTNVTPSSVDTNYQSNTFGQGSSALSGRTVNLQARFSF